MGAWAVQIVVSWVFVGITEKVARPQPPHVKKLRKVGGWSSHCRVSGTAESGKIHRLHGSVAPGRSNSGARQGLPLFFGARRDKGRQKIACTHPLPHRRLLSPFLCLPPCWVAPRNVAWIHPHLNPLSSMSGPGETYPVGKLQKVLPSLFH